MENITFNRTNKTLDEEFSGPRENHKSLYFNRNWLFFEKSELLSVQVQVFMIF